MTDSDPRSPGRHVDTGAKSRAEGPVGARLRMPRRLRITRHVEFERVMHVGLRLGDKNVTLWGRRSARVHSRIGLVVGRRHGGAVHRNLLKRRLRAAFRLSQQKLPPGLDLVCMPRPGVRPTVAELQVSLVRLAAELIRRLRSHPEADHPQR
ncbi:MAG: ribonuclease P protein component [Phycisphaerales bacterium]|nr:ribonuclease P protein component [Phycisphaerales bacterium]